MTVKCVASKYKGVCMPWAFTGTTRREALLLKRRDDGRMLELRDVELGQHSGRGIDVEHLLDRLEVRRSARVAAEIIVLEQIGVQHGYRRFQLFGNHLEGFRAIG